MSIQHLPNDATPDQVAGVLKEDGCVVVDRLADPALLATFRQEIEPYLQATRMGSDGFSGESTRRTGALVARSPAAREMVMNPTVVGTVGKVLSHAKNFQLHLTQVIAIGAGETGQDIHRDQWAFDFFPFPKGYEVQCNTLWAATDFTEQNGATRVIPGSHLFDDKIRFEHADTVPAEMERGSVLFYTGALYHGGGANRTDSVRIGVNITYNVAWLRQEENQYLSVPLEIARELPDPLLRMMGYARGAYALGYIDDLRDPIEALGRAPAKTGFGEIREVQSSLSNT